jgi:hypothetical protein
MCPDADGVLLAGILQHPFTFLPDAAFEGAHEQ